MGERTLEANPSARDSTRAATDRGGAAPEAGNGTAPSGRSAAAVTPAIESLNLRKTYGNHVAVAGLTLAIAPGEIFGFLGPNGAGKSTVVKMLLGLIFPSGGSARLLGQPIGDAAVKARVGFLPEHFRFHEWLQAGEFLDFHASLYRMPAQQRRQRIGEALDLVGLASRAKDRLHTFSKGMLQRVGIAQALLNDPEVVFLDEPTSALDPLGRREVRDLIRKLKAQGKTVFLNSHLLSEVEMVCDRVAILDRGRVVREGLLGDLLGESHEVELQIGNLTPELRQELSERYRLVHADGVAVTLGVTCREEIPAIAEAVIRGGGRLYGLTVRRFSLEDLFVAVVEGGSER